MYPFKSAMNHLKGLVRSRSRPERSIVEEYIIEEVIELYTDFLNGVEPIDLPKSRYKGRLQDSDTIGYKIISMSLEL
jgi:Domain of unknown function (DUF4218)